MSKEEETREEEEEHPHELSYTEEECPSDNESASVITVIHLDSVSVNSDDEFEDILGDLEVEGGDKFEEDSALTDFIGRAFSLSALDKKKKKSKGSSGSSTSSSNPPVRRFLSHQESDYIDLTNIPPSEDHVYFDIDDIRKEAEKEDENEGKKLAESIYMTMERKDEDDYMNMADMSRGKDNVYMNLNNQSLYQNLPNAYPDEHIYASLKRPKNQNSKASEYENIRMASDPLEGRLQDGYVLMEDRRKYENLPSQNTPRSDEFQGYDEVSRLHEREMIESTRGRNQNTNRDIRQPREKPIINKGSDAKKISSNKTELEAASNQNEDVNTATNETEGVEIVGEPGDELSNTVVNPLEVCFSCKQTITDSALFEVNDAFYHTSCLTCSLCHNLLSVGLFSVDPNNILICNNCNGTICGVCRQLCSQHMDFKDLRLGKIYHLSCLTCSLCNNKFYCDDPPVLTDDGSWKHNNCVKSGKFNIHKADKNYHEVQQFLSENNTFYRDLSFFEMQLLDEHNMIRKKFEMEKVKWSKKLTGHARRWAIHLSVRNKDKKLPILSSQSRKCWVQNVVYVPKRMKEGEVVEQAMKSFLKSEKMKSIVSSETMLIGGCLMWYGHMGYLVVNYWPPPTSTSPLVFSP